MTNSSLYGNEYELPYYMIDLRKSIFDSDINTNISTVRQNLQTTYVNRLLSIVKSSSYDNHSKTSAFYNLNWIKENLDVTTANLQSRQHKKYLLYLVESLENK
jgi:hypothetical protein